MSNKGPNTAGRPPERTVAHVTWKSDGGKRKKNNGINDAGNGATTDLNKG